MPAAALLCALVGATASGCGGDEPATAAGSTASTTSRAPAADVRPFAASSPWNQRVDGLAQDPQSAALLRRAAQRVGVIERRGDARPRIERRTVTAGVTVNTRAWTTPVVSDGVVTAVRCRQRQCGDGEAVRSLRIPADVDPDPRYDGWFTVIEGRTAYDLWRARRERDGAISYQFLRVWDLDGSGAGAPGEVAARGSGLPLFAGLIRARELETGRIDHALAISLPGPAQRRYVRPASATNGNGSLRSLPEGARIRLKPGVRLRDDTIDGRTVTRRQQRARDAILVALRSYGALVVDRAAVPTLYAERGIAGETLTGDELRGLGLDDFEVVQLGRILEDPPADEEQDG
ncbi:hypothetical protein LRS13_11170 [Svornostia abyssi]|uniref:Lipoprotein n=1 Tax=Svornostia abyssi TaxID=2898438 RepID=A0ABY5PMW1_9ACTN|nr:hypothetical protein LRS13_11170 [Parviterribacteraceae bacterium J379]